MSLETDAALLMGFPFSPVAVAARRLAAIGIPYVIDAGDPWILTAETPPNAFIGGIRARRAERVMWQRAQGAILTTEQQASALRSLFPDLDILVRPNGFTPCELPAAVHPRADAEILRLAHFGLISHVRVAIRPFLKALLYQGRWKGIELHAYGPDWSGALGGMPAGISIVQHKPCPWSEILREVNQYDAALVIGNKNPGQLPSKVVSYLTLPRPRIALVERHGSDALSGYLRDKRGWLIVTADDPDLATRVRTHIATPWTLEDLRPPRSESWDQVRIEIAAFIERCLALGSPEQSRFRHQSE